MRTTLSINDDLLVRAKELAARRRTSLGEIVDNALRLLFAERSSTLSAAELPTDGGSGLRPGVDLEDKDALAALLDEPAAATGR